MRIVINQVSGRADGEPTWLWEILARAGEILAVSDRAFQTYATALADAETAAKGLKA